MTAAVRIILVHAEPNLKRSICEDQTKARSKNIPHAVYKSGDGIDLPVAFTFMLHATPAPIFYNASFPRGWRLRGFSLYNLVGGD